LNQTTIHPGVRVGIGFDVHRLVEGRRLILGGVEIQHPAGLLGHSDADVVLHAVTDALLGAAGLPDIGEMFPDTDPVCKDADSRKLLIQAMNRVQEVGYVVGNVDIVVHAQLPKITPHKSAMTVSIAEVLGCTAKQISIKGRTNEGLGYLGRGEAIACTAVALLVEKKRRNGNADG
jgi:2-C-methyl-D-erythritol 2,4-cyclodiphosphate synthase